MSKRIHNGLNLKERKIVAQFVKAGRPHAMTLDELAEVFAYVGKVRSNSWARNSIRRPIALGILEPTGPKGTGAYRITATGRELVKSGALLLNMRVEAKKSAKKAPKAKVTPVVEPKVEAAPTPAPTPVALVVVEPKVVEVPVVVEVAPAPTNSADNLCHLISDIAEDFKKKQTEEQPAPWTNEPA